MPYAACRHWDCHPCADKNRFFADELVEGCFFGLVIATGHLVTAGLSRQVQRF